MIRSRFLTYWTGKDMETEIGNLNNATRKEYLERLWSILDDGFWMNEIKEKVFGWHDNKPKAGINMKVPMVCFTELRLSQAQKHCKKYGLLGLVVDREFVLKRHGAPVFYIPSHANETVVGNLVQTLSWIDDQNNRGTTGADQLLKNLFVPISYLKAMSTSGTDDFENLDENEWRIVHTDRLKEEGLIKHTGHYEPKYMIPLKPKELKMIVLPDTEVCELVKEDDRIKDWFNGKLPPLDTVEKIREI